MQISVVTYNVGEVEIDKESFADKLFENLVDTKQNIDLQVLNFQEVIKLGSITCINKYSKVYIDFEKFVEQYQIKQLKMQDQKLEILQTQHNCGLQQIIIGKKNSVHLMKPKQLNFGFQGYVGNKGAIISKLEYNNRIQYFVNVHFEAHENKESKLKRQNQFDMLLKKVQKNYYKQENNNENKKDQFIFLAGDTNSRTLDQKENDRSHNLNNDDFNLLKHEHKKLSSKKIEFPEFELEMFEGKIKFDQTQKFKVNEDVYDTKRKPAWTDRVFVFYNNKYDIRKYNQTQRRLNNVKFSDHRPVEFRINMKEDNKLKEKHQ